MCTDLTTYAQTVLGDLKRCELQLLLILLVTSDYPEAFKTFSCLINWVWTRQQTLKHPASSCEGIGYTSPPMVAKVHTSQQCEYPLPLRGCRQQDHLVRRRLIVPAQYCAGKDDYRENVFPKNLCIAAA
eukprot:3596515-Amphidinium_carterae.1